MGFRQIVRGVMMTVCMLLLPVAGMAGDDMGRIPPGVRMYRGGEAVEDGSQYMAHVIYTKDDPKKITAFYRKTLGVAPIRGRSFYLGDIDDGPIFLTVEPASGRQDRSIAESYLFGGMEDDMMDKWAMGTARHGKSEFQQLKKEYAHLSRGWYPDFDVKERLDECIEGSGGDDGEAFKDGNERQAARIQELIAQGRQDEATRLAYQSGNRGLDYQNEITRDRWDDWVACFKEIDGHDYQARILIGKIHGRYTPATARGRKRARRRLDAQDAGRGGRESQSGSSSESNTILNEGVGKLKGMFGF
ncbi:MAG: hypothetical protein ACE5GY_06530 [Thermodesulfobacteriota bacterium]